MNRMFFNSQCPIFPDEYSIGKIVGTDRKNRTLPRWYVCRIFRVMPFSLRSQIADILNILEFMKKELSDGRLFVSDCDVRVWK